MKRLLRRIPLLRWCAYRYALKVRQRQSDASWAHVQLILTTIGNITIAWAGIELILSHLVIWHHWVNNSRPEKGLPRMLSFQLRYIKDRIEKDMNLPADVRDKLGELRLKIEELNDFRISIIHGVLHQRNKYTTNWHTHSLKIDELSWREIKNDYSADDIAQKSKEISDLGHELSPFVAGIIGLPHPLNSAEMPQPTRAR